MAINEKFDDSDKDSDVNLAIRNHTTKRQTYYKTDNCSKEKVRVIVAKELTIQTTPEAAIKTITESMRSKGTLAFSSCEAHNEMGMLRRIRSRVDLKSVNW